MNIPSHLLPNRIGREEEADYKRRVYFWLAPPGTTPEHIVDPDYWVHWAQRLKVNDRIEVIAADGTFDMELRVIALDPRGLWAHVRPLRIVEGRVAISEATGIYPDKDGYTIELSGPHRWRIIRGQDVVARDFPDQAAAIEALQNIKAAKGGAPVPLVPRREIKASDPRPEEPVPVEEPPPPVEEPPGETEEPAPVAATSGRKRF